MQQQDGRLQGRADHTRLETQGPCNLAWDLQVVGGGSARQAGRAHAANGQCSWPCVRCDAEGPGAARSQHRVAHSDPRTLKSPHSGRAGLQTTGGHAASAHMLASVAGSIMHSGRAAASQHAPCAGRHLGLSAGRPCG